jgi:hypothetical protein
MEGQLFNKGDHVRLNQHGLDSLFSSPGGAKLREMVSKTVFIVLNYAPDGSIRVRPLGSTKAFSYNATFLERAHGGKLRKGQVVMVYEDPVTETRPEGKAQLLDLIEKYTDGIEHWWVQFLDDDFHNPVERNIKVPS